MSVAFFNEIPNNSHMLSIIPAHLLPRNTSRLSSVIILSFLYGQDTCPTSPENGYNIGY